MLNKGCEYGRNRALIQAKVITCEHKYVVHLNVWKHSPWLSRHSIFGWLKLFFSQDSNWYSGKDTKWNKSCSDSHLNNSKCFFFSHIFSTINILTGQIKVVMITSCLTQVPEAWNIIQWQLPTSTTYFHSAVAQLPHVSTATLCFHSNQHKLQS